MTWRQNEIQNREVKRTMSELSDTIRKLFKEGDDRRDAGLTTPEGILRYDDIVYGEEAGWQVLDVYRLQKEEGPLPVIVSVHGGGWVYGDKERYQYYCMDLARRGFAVVNFTYRLAPEFKYPASLEDTNRVFAWVLDHAKEYGFDRSRIFGVGDSAGAHILGLYAAICTNPDYAAAYPFQPPKGFVPAAVALNCGVYRTPVSDDEKDQSNLLMADLLPEKGTREEFERISLVNFVTSQYPPVFLMTASGDFLRDQAPLLAEKLMEFEIPFVYRYFGNADQPLGHVFHCNIRLKEASRCNDEECEFFREYC